MAWKILFGTDVGLMSLFTIAFMIGMAVFLYYFVRNKVREEEQRRIKN